LIRDSVIEGNSAVDTGGLGIRGALLVDVVDTDILGNNGAAKIGGAYVEGAQTTFDGVLFDGNTTGATLSAFQGSDLSGDITFQDCTFSNNEVSGSGYAVLVQGSETYGTVMNRVQVIDNDGHAMPIFGGAVQIEGYADLNNVLMIGNTGFFALKLDEEQVIPGPADPALQSLVNSTFADNEGDGIQVATSTSLGITLNNVISAYNDGYGVTNGEVAPAVSYCDVFGNGSGGYSDVDETGVNGNLDVDPLFEDLAGGDLHLGAGSPLLDAGDPLLMDPDGSQSDMGFYGGPGAP
jgi:hypothetical protein